MLPPSNSHLHHLHKQAEAQRTSTRPASPPPPYTQQSITIHEENLSDDDEDEYETAPACASIKINIDASITIQGNGNTIIMPSTANTNTNTQSKDQGEPASPTTPTALLQMQKHRQTKISELTTSIISALNDSNLTQNKDKENIPIEININTAIKIEGSRNVICAGTVGPKSDVRNDRNTARADGLGRKRRAQSEPIDMPESKKGRLSLDLK